MLHYAYEGSLSYSSLATVKVWSYLYCSALWAVGRLHGRNLIPTSPD